MGYATHRLVDNGFWIANDFGAISPITMCKAVITENPTAKEIVVLKVKHVLPALIYIQYNDE